MAHRHINRTGLQSATSWPALLSRALLLAVAFLLIVVALPSVVSVKNASATSSSGLVWHDTSVGGSFAYNGGVWILSTSCTSSTFCVAGGYYETPQNFSRRRSQPVNATISANFSNGVI